MFITAVCVLFLIKLRWPKNKSIYENLSNVYNFKNDFNVDLKSSRVPASTISFGKLFQSLTTLIKKECLTLFRLGGGGGFSNPPSGKIAITPTPKEQ